MFGEGMVTEGETETVGVPSVRKRKAPGSSPTSPSSDSTTCSRSGFRCNCDIDR
jgi:hypothetical protein